MVEEIKDLTLNILPTTMAKWQNIVDIMAELINVPAALIMRLVDEDIEVFVSSGSEGNPYHPGDKEHFLDSGLYCETVVKTYGKLLVPNALASEQWKNNPDVKLGMVSYLGFPILQEDGKAFGTICVLDNKENGYSDTYEELIINFREMIQSELALIHMNQVLGDENKSLNDYFAELKILRGIVVVCGFCKKIKVRDGVWITMEEFFSENTDAAFSHTFCPECGKIHYPEILGKK